MNLLKKHAITISLLAALGLAPLAAQADSDIDTGGSPTAAAHLNLRVVIPEFLYFRIGSTGGTIDRITFSPGAAVIGDSTSVSGAGGDAALGSGASVRLRSNGGQVTIARCRYADPPRSTGLSAFHRNDGQHRAAQLKPVTPNAQIQRIKVIFQKNTGNR